LIKYEAHKHLDSIETIIHPESRVLPESHPLDIPCVYLCGHTSEIHRWAVNLDEEDFFKQIELLKQVISGGEHHHIIVGVTRTNFHRLNDILQFIKELKRLPFDIAIPGFPLIPMKEIKSRFYKYFDTLKTIGHGNDIEFRVVDQRFDELLSTIEAETNNGHYNEHDLLRALGPVSKDVFIGPKFLLLDLSGKCNLDCVYCRGFSNWNMGFIDSKPESITRFLDLPIIRNILQEAKETGVECVLLVGGGEPTLNPNFLEIIGLIKKLGLKFNFSTNGTLLDRYNEYILDGSCESVTVSLSYASKETFKKFRPGSNPKLAHKIEKSIKILSTMKKAKNTVFPHIIVLFAICRYNCHEIVPFVEFAKALGANAIWYQMVHLEDFSKDKLMLSPEKMQCVNKDLQTAKQLCRQYGINFSSFIDFELERYDEHHGDWSKGGLLEQGCFVGWHFSFIFLRAEVYFCCGARTVGYLDKDGKGFRDLWFSDTYKRYRNDGLILHEENPICLNGRMLYDKYCDSCDNHDQNNMIIDLLKRYGLLTFVQRHKERRIIGSANILLVMSPPWGVDNPPMPLGYLARYLRDKGIGYEIFDLNLALFNRSRSDRKKLWNVENDHIWRNTPSGQMISQLDGFEKLMSRIIDSDSTVVGFSLVDPNQFISCHVIKRIKEECPRKIIVVGGPVCATLEERIWLKDNTDGLIDFIVVGEGEKPLVELLRKLGASLTNKEIVLPGVVDCRYSGDMAPHSMGSPLDLSEISFPDYKGFPLDLYHGKSTAVMWSRGCISNCAFCKEKSLWDKHRTRPIEDIIAEIRFYKGRDISEFVVYDSLVNGRPEHLEMLCDTIITQGLNIRWSALAIPDKSLSKGLLEKMKSAGCFVLIFGLESGSEKVLKRMRKRFLLKHAIETIKNTKHAGIETAINIIVGFPGENEDDFEKTLDFLERYHGYIGRLDAVTPLQLVRGTYLFNYHDKFNIIFPEERAHEYWSTEDGMNTYKIRMQRHQKIIEMCNQHGIGIRKTFFGEKGTIAKKPKELKEIQRGLDILFLSALYDEILDYDTASILEYLKQHNIPAAYLTENSRTDPDENLLTKLNNFDAKFLAVKASGTQHDNTFTIVKKLRDTNKCPRIILWGPGCRTEDQRKKFSLNRVDGIIFQEYEKAFKKLILYSKNDLLDTSCIPGTYVPGQPFIPLPPTRNLSKHPFPRYKEVDFSALNIDALPLRLSKGCPYRCSFCSIYDEEGPYRVRETGIVYEEMCYHLEKNGISEHVFQDRAINGNHDTLNKLCDIMASNKSSVTWKAKYIVRKGADDFLFREMTGAGCTHLNFGFISGSDHVLQLMGKPFDVNIVESALRNAHEMGIRTSVRLMVGYPGEKETDFWKTVSFLFNNEKYIDEVADISPCYLQPGCDLETAPERYGIILPRGNQRQEWHNGSYNNYSYRLKKQKEMVIVLAEMGLLPGTEPYIRSDEEILANTDKILNRYSCFSKNLRGVKKTDSHLSPNPETVRDPIMAGIMSDTDVCSAPEILEIDLTNNCNLNCIGCWCHSPLLGDDKFDGKTKKEYLPTEKVLSVLKDVERIGGTVAIQLTGAGEPFMHPGIWNIIETIKKCRMACHIVTNFSLIDRHGVKRLVDLGVDAITASIWAGDSETYGRNHPGALTDLFYGIHGNLCLLTELRGAQGLPKLKIYHVLNINNADNINLMVESALQVGANDVEFQMMDAVPGKTDAIRLNMAAGKSILHQFQMLRQRPDYTDEFIGSDHLKLLNNQTLRDELMEFGRIYPCLPEGFLYSDDYNAVRCPNGVLSTKKYLSHEDFSVTFAFDQRECLQCHHRQKCCTDPTKLARLRVYPMNILGIGSFFRRLTGSKEEIQEYERQIVDQLPCTVGWTYSRIKVDGHVIPCCKASDFPLGNIHEDSFSNIWRAHSYSRFRQKAKKLPKSDPYFAKINCYKSCDNVGMNLNAYLRLLNSQGKNEGGGS